MMKDPTDRKTLDMFDDSSTAKIEALLAQLNRMEAVARSHKSWPGVKSRSIWLNVVRELKELGYEEPETPRPIDPQDAEGQG